MAASTTRKRILIGVISAAVALATAFGVYLALGAFLPNNSTDDLIAKTVQEMKDTNQFPAQIDEITRLDDVTAEPSAVHYHYTITDTDPADVSEQALKDSVLLQLCSTEETRRILDRDIQMKYSYDFDGFDDSYHLEFSKSDC
ncbi:hypothetical protein BKA04_001256 [Cryobacterium mesophilum]|uniref:Uncharacterized protein n=1 Tax=Terrimesophilobacter mesophilus TaxID=433647 RepID=A0A4V3I9K4_9MICO|nr:hypothetical protein [Terrimesophilobacter mesophilus]MBB5633033.1 hypothetical protein [Terrimesophilobacter mesophilus]TFB79798.1 hypothetical protein E3N84_06920 [Terrimesophilobacter mesophilus]